MRKTYDAKTCARWMTGAALLAGTMFATSPAMAACSTVGGTLLCDSSAPNPVQNGAVGNDIHILAGAEVRQSDPFAGASPQYDAVSVTANGRLRMDPGSRVSVSIAGQTGVAAGSNSTIDVAGTIVAGGASSNNTAVSLASGAKLIVQEGGFVDATSAVGTAIRVNGSGSSILIDGAVRDFSVNLGPAIDLVSTDMFLNEVRYASDIRVGSTGQLLTTGGPGQAVTLTGGSRLTVAGTVTTRLAEHAVDYIAGPGATVVIDVVAGGTIAALSGTAITGNGANVDLTIAGTVTSAANRPAVLLGDGADRVTLVTGAVIGGAIDGGASSDRLVLTGSGAAQLGAIANFEAVDVNAGTWTLGTTISPSGGTTIAGGATLNASTALLGGLVRNDGTLVLDQASGGTFSESLSGAGVLVKRGTGALTLTGTSSFAGQANIDVGTLVVNGSLAGSMVRVAPGAVLSGNGTIGTTTVAGTISPTGTLKVNGNYMQATGSTYAWQTGDLVQVSGVATLAGGRVQASGALRLGDRIAILTAAGGRSGRFDGVDLDNTGTRPFLGFGLTYDANTAYLEVVRSNVSFASAGNTANQIAVARSLDVSAVASPIAIAVADVTDFAAARQGFDALAGDLHATLKGVLLDQSRYVREAFQRRLASDHGTGLELWMQALGGRSSGDSDGNAATYTGSEWGWLFGADAVVGAGIRAGLSAGYTRSKIDADERAAHANVSGFHLGAYAGRQWGGTRLNAGASMSWDRIATRRMVTFSNFTDATSARYHGRQLNLFAELAQHLDLNSFGLEPFAGIAWTRLRTDAFIEQGGDAALRATAESESAAWTTAGLRAKASLGRSVELSGSAAWRHTVTGAVPTASLALATGTAFTIRGLPLDRDAALLSAGIALPLLPNASFGIDYSGLVGARMQDHGGRANVSFRF